MKISRGFTLVELAVVLTIIALLIGGVLKGQEVLENSQMTSTISLAKSVDSAVTLFKTKYRDLPGDMMTPSARLPNCTTAPCNTAGNGNGQIPIPGSAATTTESNTLWLHLAAAGLFSIPSPSADGRTQITPPMSPATYLIVGWYDYTSSGAWYAPSGNLYGHWMFMGDKRYPAAYYATPVNKLMKLDVKGDDGMPWSGGFLLDGGACGIAQAAGTRYDPNNVNLCGFQFDVTF